MNSLQQLNDYGNVHLDVPDTRSSVVKFDRVAPLLPLDQNLKITSTSLIISPGIEITEIVNYNVANVRYRVTLYPGTVTPLTGSTISWASLPSGVTQTTVGNVYTLSGLKTVADWQAVRQFTWTLPSNYLTKPFWYLEVKVIYYDSALAQDVSKTWLVYDLRFYYTSRMTSTATISCTLTGKQYLAAALTSTASLTAEGGYGPGTLTSTESSAFSLTCNLTALATGINNKTYTANNENSLTGVQIGDGNPATTSTFSVTITSSLGLFSPNSTTYPTNPLIITGTLTAVNSSLATLKFYPTKGSTASGTYSFTVTKDSVQIYTNTKNFTGTSGTYSSATYSFTNSTLWTPSNIDLLYSSSKRVLLVGGGGGGGETFTSGSNTFYGNGGGGGGFIDTTSVTITSQSYTIVIGDGGNGFNINATYPTDGGNTTAFGLTAYGGKKGRTSYGGDSGAPTTHIGALQQTGYGGGGGGAGESGNVDGIGYGGDGLSSNITGSSVYYGGGGAGVSSGPSGNGGDGGGGGYGATNGTPNTGGGGAGGAYGGAGYGGSGVVIVKFVA